MKGILEKRERATTFRHGVRLEEHKEETRMLAIERVPFVEEYVLPLSQHIGAPSVALVHPGQYVERGEMIAKAGGFVSTALHAPVNGTVQTIELRPHPSGKLMPAIVLKTDPFASQQNIFPPPPDPSRLQLEDAITAIRDAGIVGMGGAAFPAHVKLKTPEGKKIRIVILNGCECEPYLTCDHRLMAQRPEEVIRGLLLLLRFLNAEHGYIGVETNKPDALEALQKGVRDFPEIRVMPLQVKYPQGAEKMLIDAVFHREVPSGKLPLDLEMIVQNVATSAALADYFDRGSPLLERVVTVTGDGVGRPGNYLVPLGTPIGAVLDYCGGLKPEVRQIIMGGPMMGAAQKNLETPVVKGTSGLLVLKAEPPDPNLELPCIRCGKCLEACPLFLNPSRLAFLVRAGRVEALEDYHLADCFECASCSLVCPSHIPLVQLMRMGKALLRERKNG